MNPDAEPCKLDCDRVGVDAVEPPRTLEELAGSAGASVWVVVGGPYNSGILATGAVPGARYNYKEAPPEILERVRAIPGVKSAGTTTTLPMSGQDSSGSFRIEGRPACQAVTFSTARYRSRPQTGQACSPSW